MDLTTMAIAGACHYERTRTMTYNSWPLTKKLLRILKLTSVLILVACLQVAARSSGQMVSLFFKQAPLKEVFREIQRQTSMNVMVKESLLERAGKVTIDVKNIPVNEALELCLKNLPLNYKIESRVIIVEEKNNSLRKEETQDMIPITIEVTGTVIGPNGEPVAGANVMNKTTGHGTSTDDLGRFSLTVNVGDILIVTYVGYASQSVAIKDNATSLSIKMKLADNKLDEVQIIAYGQTTKRLQTGNVSTVKAAEIEKQPVSNPLLALQGRMTGVYIQQNTGLPGGGVNIQIRGKNSLRDGNAGTINGNLPFYIVDGVPFTNTAVTSTYLTGSNLGIGNPLASINPRDIESIEVLKDADATSIYGSRGANGVVLITTKKAKSGKTNVDFDIYTGIGEVSNNMNLLTTPQYLEMRHEALENDGYAFLLADPAFDIYWPDLKIWDTTRYTDWQKELIGGKAHVTNAQMSISGGNSNTQFTFGGGYYRESTVFPGDNAFQRASGRLNLNHSTQDKRFNIVLSLNYSSTLNQIPSLDFTRQAVELSPNAPELYNPDGSLNWENGTWTNPLSSLERTYESTIDNLVTNAAMRYTIAKGLNARVNLGYSTMQTRETSLNPLSAFNPQDLQGRTGSSLFGNGNLKTWIIEPQLEYNTRIGKGDLSLLAGATLQESVQDGETLQAFGYTNDALLENIDAASSIDIVNATSSQYRYSAFFARATYNWSNKYLLNLTGRRDGSSRFGPGNHFANFGAVGAAWIFSNETFLKDILPLSFGKLRASYGTTGSDAISNYQYLTTYSATTYPYNNSTGFVITRLGNPDYSWETNRKMEAAIDLGFINDHITFSAAYYRNRSSNQLVGFSLPAMTGQTSIQYNLPATVENTGWELTLNSNLDLGQVQWTASFNITIPKNELTEFPEIENYPVYNNRYEVGKSLFAYKAYQYIGVDPTSGVYTFRDIDGDGSISGIPDRVVLKEVAQKFYGGLNNGFSWKGLQLDVFIQFVKQTAIGPERHFNTPGDLSNQPSFVMNRWQKPGDVTSIQQFTAFDPVGNVVGGSTNYRNSDGVIRDASFIRLKNISLSWSLPSEWMKKAKIKRSRIYMQAQNLLTFTDYLGLDPESQSLSLPPLRMITAGLQITL